MADVQPLRAIRYDPAVTGALQDVVAPPYDVIDAGQRAALVARSPFNVVQLDLPEGEDPYATAAALFEQWQLQGALKRDATPALWVLDQDYTGPDGDARTRRGFFARVRVEDYGPGRIRPHERTHPGPREDRLRLTRATRANLSPIFSLYSDATGQARATLESATAGAPHAETTDDDGTANRLWRLEDPEAITALQRALGEAELLIADGHHRYETARVYAQEVGGEGEHSYALMCLVALEDPGLTVFPTHRLVKGLDSERQTTLGKAIRADFEIEQCTREQLAPPEGGPPLQMGYIDSHHGTPYRITLRDQGRADAALPGRAPAYRKLDTGVLEALLLKGALGMTDDDISHLRDFWYARDTAEALALIDSGEFQAAFIMRPTPVAQVREIAAAGENMPPKSTYFYPKVPTGLLFNALE